MYGTMHFLIYIQLSHPFLIGRMAINVIIIKQLIIYKLEAANNSNNRNDGKLCGYVQHNKKKNHGISNTPTIIVE